MEIHPQILIFGGSLIAILALAGLAALMKLGGKPVLASDSDAAQAAGEVSDGFEPVEIALDAQGASALLCDSDGRIMLIKRHGNQFAGRILSATANAKAMGDGLEVVSGESRFGAVCLVHPDAASWVEAINRLRESHHA